MTPHPINGNDEKKNPLMLKKRNEKPSRSVLYTYKIYLKIKNSTHSPFPLSFPFFVRFNIVIKRKPKLKIYTR